MDSDFGFPAGKISLVRKASRCGRLARFPVGQQTPWVCTDEKSFRFGGFKFCFGGCTPAYRASVLLAFLRSIVQADAGSRRAGERLVASCLFLVSMFVTLSP